LRFGVRGETLAVLFMQSDRADLPLTDRFWAWYDVNKNIAIGAVLGIVLLGGAIFTFIWWRDQKEVKASEALADVSLARTTDATRTETQEDYLKSADSHSGASAAERATLMAAGTYFTEGKYDQAKTQFEKFRREHPGSPFMAQALLGIAACYDAMKKAPEAISAYKDIIDHHGGESVVPQAKFALANLYEGQGKFDQARPLFEDVARNGQSSVGSEAGMRLEELKAKHPELFPTSPAPASSLPKGLTRPMPQKK
jgi:tetratricopeptide (TPR) repeat protein